MNKLVSVVIPVKNREAYLAETVKSILNQTYKDIEIILVDDGSTDDVKYLYAYYQKNFPNIRVIHKESSGISATRNRGIKEAKGDYIAVFDSDDLMSPDKIKKQMKAIGDCDFCYHSYYVGNQQAVIKRGVMPKRKIEWDDIKNNSAWPHFTILAKKKCFEENPYRDDFVVNDDAWLCYKWFVAGYKAKFVKEPLAILRWHPSNTSRTRQLEIQDVQKILDKEYEDYENSRNN